MGVATVVNPMATREARILKGFFGCVVCVVDALCLGFCVWCGSRISYGYVWFRCAFAFARECLIILFIRFGSFVIVNAASIMLV